MTKLLRALTQAIALYATLMIMTCVMIWSAVEVLAWVVESEAINGCDKR